MQELPKRSESEIGIGPEIEPKVGKVESLVKKILGEERDYLSDEMYKLMSGEEKEAVKKSVRDSKEISDEKKEYLLFALEALDKAAKREYEKLKESLKAKSPIEGEEELKKVKEETEFKRRAAKEIDELRSKMTHFFEEAKSKQFFKETTIMNEDVIKKLRNLLKSLEIKGETARSIMEAQDELKSERKELGRLSTEEKNERGRINSAKGDYYRWGYTKEKREEDVKLCEEKITRFERILEEIKTEEEK